MSFSIPLDAVPPSRRDFEATRPPPGCPYHYYGIARDAPDDRDHLFEAVEGHELSSSVDLRKHCPAIYNQGTLGSCTAQAVAGAFEYATIKEGTSQFSPSRLFIWYNARARSDDPEDVKKNVGSSLRTAIKTLAPTADGVCSESVWPYEESAFDTDTRVFVDGAKAAQRPSNFAIEEAHNHTAISIQYRKFSTNENLAEHLMQCLDQGNPFVFGMEHADILYPLTSGKKVVPDRPSEVQMQDHTHGHALMAVGYNKEEGRFIIRNSWGADWCEDGYFYLPFDFLDICFDFWSIQSVKNTDSK